VLDGQWHEAGGERFLVIDRTYAPGHRHGDVALMDAMPPSDGLWPRLSLLLAGTEGTAVGAGRMLFIDLETTGLTGGAGTYAFLVGCGWFQPPSPPASAGHGPPSPPASAGHVPPSPPTRQSGVFHIRQFFLSSFAAERALLDGLCEAAAAAGAVVTYNGKTFDLPLIDTRFMMNRMATPFGGIAHIDMLHPARRLWRTADDARPDGEAGSCRLSVLEQTVCGHVRDHDVPGFEIPSRYFHYVRSGDARPLGAVLEHNRLDLLSLALLTSRAAQLLDEGPAAARSAREALGLGRLYEKGGLPDEACGCFERAADLPGDATAKGEALRAVAVLSRRARRFQHAAAAWRRILGLPRCPAHLVREATEALAVHHEHRLKEPAVARSLALQALQFHATASRRDALHYRLARLDRKLRTAPPPQSAPLF
jgi:uncharacterized protein YprB with RNaseH-like and TPR domain